MLVIRDLSQPPDTTHLRPRGDRGVQFSCCRVRNKLQRCLGLMDTGASRYERVQILTPPNRSYKRQIVMAQRTPLASGGATSIKGVTWCSAGHRGTGPYRLFSGGGSNAGNQVPPTPTAWLSDVSVATGFHIRVNFLIQGNQTNIPFFGGSVTVRKIARN